MAGGSAWSRRVAARTRHLRGIVKDTQRALHDVVDILHIDPDVFTTVQEVGTQSLRCTALVVLGTSSAARARLLHCLLGQQILPDPVPRGCRWVRIQYSSSNQRQAHLSLGNSEFELVEELECNKRPWDTLPVEDLKRHDKTDLTTILEVEINNQFLKDGIRIILPPDLELDPGDSSLQTLKNIYADFIAKRGSLLKNFNPIYLFAVDKIGKNIFSDNISGSITSSRSEEDFWNTFNLYFMAKGSNVEDSGETGSNEESGESAERESEVVCDNGDLTAKTCSEPAVFSSENCLDLYQIKEVNSHAQVMFVLFSDSEDMNRVEVPEENKRPDKFMKWIFRQKNECSNQKTAGENKRLCDEQTVFISELIDQWELVSKPPPKHHVKSQCVILDDSEANSVDQRSNPSGSSTQLPDAGKKKEMIVKNRARFLSAVVKFAADCMQTYLLAYSTKLSEVHVKLVQQLILASFDMARELQVVPKKIQYVARQEQQLFEKINKKFSEGHKKRELLQLMQEVLDEMRNEVDDMDWTVDDLPWHRDPRFAFSNSYFTCRSVDTVPMRMLDEMPAAGEEAVCYDSYNFDDYDIIRPNEESFCESFVNIQPPEESISADSPHFNNIRVETESEKSSLSRMLWSNAGTSTSTCTNSANISIKQASLDVQQTVLTRLSQKISLKLTDFMDCLKDTYFGTLQRCVESLEESCRRELGGRPASAATRQLQAVARGVELAPGAAFPLLRSLRHVLRRLLHRLRLVGGEEDEACCVLSPLWRRRVAASSLQQLSPHRLATLISTQILEKLSLAHEKYQSALKSLESALANRLHHTGDIKIAIRKRYAPMFARLCLESTSMCDLLMYGVPELGREIGRGQFGVVYSSRAWAGHAPVAVKSVLPADERHYRELALEFFYTRSIPPHPRVLRLLGSVVQRGAPGVPGVPGVLLVTERRTRDLHAAVRAGLSYATRMRIALDVVEGIRYLHSLGLVHRDVKLKNVLLDAGDRAALADLGFCCCAALLGGSLVGTPVHMAPELLAGRYAAPVDVYAFGILFWYICAGNINLPSAFEFQTKEQLWSNVKRGLRPERLPHFSDECWEVMQACWDSEPSRRPLLGTVHHQLEHIYQQALTEDQQTAPVAEQQSDDHIEGSLEL